MSVLSDREICELVRSSEAVGCPLIDPFDTHAVEGASYDMRLGSLMVVSGKPRTVEPQVEAHTLEPGDFVVLTTLERLWLPIDIIGHNGIMSPWARSGLVSLFSPQIDPGFVGVLEVPVFNAGDAPVQLIPGRRMFTVEFVRMSTPASVAWVDKYGPKSPPSDPLPPSALRPNLKDVEALKVSLESLERSLQGFTSQTNSALDAVRHSIELTDTRVAGLADLDARRLSRAGVRIGKWQVFWAVLAVVVAAAAFLIGVGSAKAGDHGKSPGTTTSITSAVQQGG